MSFETFIPLFTQLHSNAVAYALALSTCGLLYILVRQVTRRSYRLPPQCPPPKDKRRPYLHFEDMAKRPEYSEIMCFQTGTRVTVVLNSQEAVHELLEKRSAIYSSRPPMVLANIGRGNTTGTMLPNTVPWWRKWRSTLAASLTARAADSYTPSLNLESVELLKRLLDQPDRWNDHLTSFAANGVSSIGYGWRHDDVSSDPALILHNKAAARTFGRMGALSIVESYPICRFVPDFIARHYIPELVEARASWREDGARFRELFDEAKRRIDAGSPAHSMVRSFHEQGLKQTGLPPDVLITTCAIPFAAGLESTMGTFSAFAATCLTHGDAFIAKAQKELDDVTGGERLPTLDDELPFVRATIKEIARWARALPMAVPHATAAHDVFNGWDIPAGSAVIANVYALARDPRVYRDPYVFRPERWLDGSTSLHMPTGYFGYGRRSCPGAAVAMNLVVLAVAKILWAFDIKATAAFDEDNLDNYRSSPISHWPMNVPASFTVRSPRHAAIIAEEHRAAKPELDALADKY